MNTPTVKIINNMTPSQVLAEERKYNSIRRRNTMTTYGQPPTQAIHDCINDSFNAQYDMGRPQKDAARKELFALLEEIERLKRAESRQWGD